MNAALKDFDPIATAAAVHMMAAQLAAANVSAISKSANGQSQRASSPKDPKYFAVRKKEKKGSEKEKKKSVTHSPTAKDHDGRY